MTRERTREETEPHEHDRAPVTGARTPGGDQFVDGPIPQVVAEADDDNVRELKTKVGGLVAKRFGGDYKKAFTFYDADHDGGVGKDEITTLLKDAGVGNGLTRGAWASGIIDKVDADKDGKIEWSEFESVFSASA